MNKKNLLMSLFAMIIAIFSLMTFTSCKDDNEDDGWVKTYPRDESYEPFEIKNAVGALHYSKDEKKWYFNLKNKEEVLYKNFGDESGATIEIANANNELKSYQDSVSIDGSIRLLYVMCPKKSDLPLVSYHYALTIENISNVYNTNF